MVWMCFAAVCAYFVKGLCGFANTLVFTSILSFGTDNVKISPVDLLLGYPANLILGWRNRAALNWRVWAPLAVLVLLGNIPGIFLLKMAGAAQIKILFGAVIIGLGAEMLWRERAAAATAKTNKAVLAVIGILSGFLCGLYGIGALLAAYVSRVTTDSAAFKANISMVFAVENTFRILLYTVTGILTLEIAGQALLLYPAMLVGLFAGMAGTRFLKEKTVKHIVILLLIVSGFALILTR